MSFTTGYPYYQSNNIILVKSIGDMPDPVLKDGVMTIIPKDREYLFVNDISSVYPIAHPVAGNRATFASVNRAKWIYTGTDSCFRDLDAQGDIETQGLMWFEAPNGNMWEIDGDGWSFQASGGPKFTNMLSVGYVKGGSFNLHFGSLTNYNQGSIFENMSFFEINLMFVNGNNQPGCVHFTGQGASSSGSINFITPTLRLGSNETAFNIKPEVQSGIDSLNFRGCQQEGGINGTVFAPGSLTQKSLKVVAAANNFMSDSKRIGSAYVKNNANITTAIVNGTFKDVNFGGLLLPGSNIERFTLTNTTNGELTYNGETEFNGVIRTSISAISAGGNRIFHFRFVKNGLVLPDDMITSVDIGAEVGSTSLTTPITMQPGDTIKPQVTRVDGTSSVTVRQYSCNVS